MNSVSSSESQLENNFVISELGNINVDDSTKKDNLFKEDSIDSDPNPDRKKRKKDYPHSEKEKLKKQEKKKIINKSQVEPSQLEQPYLKKKRGSTKKHENAVLQPVDLEKEESIEKAFLRGRERIVNNLTFEQKLYLLSKILETPKLRDSFTKPIPTIHGLVYDSSSDDENEDDYEAKLSIPPCEQINSFLKMTLPKRNLKNPSKFYKLLSQNFFHYLLVKKCLQRDEKDSSLQDVEDMVSFGVDQQLHSSQQVPWSPSRTGGGKGIMFANLHHRQIITRILNTLTFQDILFYISRDLDKMNTYSKDDFLTTHFFGKTDDPSGWVFDHEPLKEIDIVLPPTAQFPAFLKRLRETYSLHIQDTNSFEEKFATIFENAASH